MRLRWIVLFCLLTSPLTLYALEIGQPTSLSDLVSGSDEYMKVHLRGCWY